MVHIQTDLLVQSDHRRFITKWLHLSVEGLCEDNKGMSDIGRLILDLM